MRHFKRITRKHAIFDLLDNFWAIESRDIFVGVDRDERRSDTGVNLVFVVSKDEVIEDAVFCEVVHEAHIIVILHWDL